MLHIHGGREGGAERFFVRLANALGRRGVEQVAAIRPGRSWRDAVRPEFCRLREALTTHARWKIDVIWPLRVHEIAASFDPDVVMSWLPAKTARFFPYGRALKIARLGGYYPLRHYRRADILVCNTPDLVRHVATGGFVGDHAALISNFVEEPGAAPPLSREEIAGGAVSDGTRIVLGLGRLDAEKGFDILLRALALTPPHVRLALVGEGRERGRLEALARELGVADRVHMPGWAADPAPWIAGCDVLAMSSREEPLGNVVLEAWRASKPVVALDSPGPLWLIDKPGENGLVTPLEAPEPFARAILEVLDDPELAARLGRGGRARLDADFSEEAVCRRYIELFERADAPDRRRAAVGGPALRALDGVRAGALKAAARLARRTPAGERADDRSASTGQSKSD